MREQRVAVGLGVRGELGADGAAAGLRLHPTGCLSSGSSAAANGRPTTSTRAAGRKRVDKRHGPGRIILRERWVDERRPRGAGEKGSSDPYVSSNFLVPPRILARCYRRGGDPQQGRFIIANEPSLAGHTARHDHAMAESLTLDAPIRQGERAGASSGATPFRFSSSERSGRSWRGGRITDGCPSLEVLAAAFWRLTLNGILPHHALDTVIRLGSASRLQPSRASQSASTVRTLAHREVSSCRWSGIGAPIPGLAYAPLFLLWFGRGNKSAVLLVGFVSAPDHLQHLDRREGVKRNLGALRAGDGADNRRLVPLRHPAGALPYILTACGLGWRKPGASSSASRCSPRLPWGLGWMIVGAREFLNMDVMLSGVAVIAIIGWR